MSLWRNRFILLVIPLLFDFSEVVLAQTSIQGTASASPVEANSSGQEQAETRSLSAFLSRGDLRAEKRFTDLTPNHRRKLLTHDEMEGIRKDSLKPRDSRLLKGGGSSNGGGGGLSYVWNGHPVLITNDYWETQTYGPLEPLLAEESALGYLSRVLDQKIKPLDPFFYERLTEAIGEVLLAQWNPRRDLPLITDLGELRPVPPQDHKPVQLAIRYSYSTPGFRPLVFIDYDPDLVAKLNSQNLAMLILHEAIYIWGTELRQEDSSKVRALVNRLLSAKEPIRAMYGKVDLFSDSLRRSFFHSELRKLGFGGFVSLYEGETQQRAASELSAQRQLIYASMMGKLRGEQGGIPSMTDEEIFFQFYYFYSKEPGSQGKSLEEFVQSDQPEKKEIQRVCKAAELVGNGQGSLVLKMTFQKSMDNLLGYCRLHD